MRVLASIFMLILLGYFLVGCGIGFSENVSTDLVEISIVSENFDTSDFNLRTTDVIYKSHNSYAIPLSYEAMTMYDTELSYTYKINNGDVSNIQGYGPLSKVEDLRILVPETDIKTLDLDLEFRICTTSMGDGYHIVNVPIHFDFT